LGAGGNWGFGQDRQERKESFKLHFVVDVMGQYIRNRTGAGHYWGGGEHENRRQESRGAGKGCGGEGPGFRIDDLRLRRIGLGLGFEF